MHKAIIIILAYFFCFDTFLFAGNNNFKSYNTRKKSRLANCLKCESCNEIFTKVEEKNSHIISVHYSCPWCYKLPILDIGVWKTLFAEELAIRQMHIVFCAAKFNESLWRCIDCESISLSNLANHFSCCEDDVISTTENDNDEEKSFDTKRFCRIFNCNRNIFSNERLCKNHMIRIHSACPWCDYSLDKHINKCSIAEQKDFSEHILLCVKKNNENRCFKCSDCSGISIGKSQRMHFGTYCIGSVTNVTNDVTGYESCSEEATQSAIVSSGEFESKSSDVCVDDESGRCPSDLSPCDSIEEQIVYEDVFCGDETLLFDVDDNFCDDQSLVENLFIPYNEGLFFETACLDSLCFDQHIFSTCSD